MSRHTPGPWRYQGPDDFMDFNILHNGDSLAVAAVVSNMRNLEEIAANARLVAAAPDLLAALQLTSKALTAALTGGEVSAAQAGNALVKAAEALAKAGAES
ncbi:hypothetical protein FQZ97_873490 [compost metagenome]